jgi:PAS domain S-box-containing protein
MVSLLAFYSVGVIVGALSEAWQASRQRVREEMQEAFSQRERLRTTLLCMGDGVVATDAMGFVSLMNPVAEEMTGWSISEAAGRSVRDMFAMLDEVSQEVLENPIQRVLRSGEPRREGVRIMLTTRSERRFPVSYSAAPKHDSEGAVNGVVLVFRDETERLRIERALQQADRRKDDFLATMAHELRNPLAPISMGLELMKISAHDAAASEEIREMMERQTRHMTRLIEDLLDVSRITRGKLELRRAQVSLWELVQNAIEAVQSTIDEASHELDVRLPNEPVSLFVDPNRVAQVLTNLLVNAAKYTPPGGLLQLAADVYGDEVAITVSDNGLGIAPDQLTAIFDMFMQVRGAKESGHQGLGIGLTLVKRLVEMHGGSVEASSGGLGQGSEFRVRLPILRNVRNVSSNGSPKVHSDTSVRSTSNRRVLVVDDNEDVLHSTSRLIRALGNEVCEASDGAEAIEVAARFRPDVILMDLGMPRLNGYEAARRIREEPWGEDAVLVATSGWGQDDDRRRTKECGFDHHLVKPLALAELQSVLVEPLPKRSAPVNGVDRRGVVGDPKRLTGVEGDGNAMSVMVGQTILDSPGVRGLTDGENEGDNETI